MLALLAQGDFPVMGECYNITNMRMPCSRPDSIKCCFLFAGGMPGGMPGMGGMPGLNEILSDPEVLTAMQVRAFHR